MTKKASWSMGLGVAALALAVSWGAALSASAADAPKADAPKAEAPKADVNKGEAKWCQTKCGEHDCPKSKYSGFERVQCVAKCEKPCAEKLGACLAKCSTECDGGKKCNMDKCRTECHGWTPAAGAK